MFKKLYHILTIAAVLFAGFGASAYAQNRTVSGVVTDTQDQPLVGVAVMQDGTSNGVVTDEDGKFAISVPTADVTLVLSSLGYKGQKVAVSAKQASLTIVLEEDNTMLEETVVVGYGTQKKVNLTGAITAVDGKALENRTAHSVTNMLQGSVPGLNISTSTGTPGSNGSLNIRGVTSINDAEPIVLIDGAIGDLNRVNPNDVESISVIKDAAAAAVYGARAAYGVILVTTKSGSAADGKATVRFSGRWGWEEPTVSTDFESRGYWSVYTVDKFWMADAGKKYTTYTDADMAQLLARVNDVTENPDRPWVVEDVRNGRNQWVYYCNTDWYHELYRDRHPAQQYSLSVSGGNKGVRYFVSGSYDKETGIIKQNPDVFRKFNIRSKIDFDIKKWLKMSNNTSFYGSQYDFIGSGNDQDAFAYASRHALSAFPLKNPDGSWVYGTPMISGSYNVANGRHIVYGEGKDKNVQRKNDFSNTTEIVIQPVESFKLVGNVTYRLYQNRNTGRNTKFSYRRYPGADMEYYSTGAGLDELSESVATYNYLSGNVFANYENTWNDAHHFTAVAGTNIESWHSKTVSASGQNLLSEKLNDLNLVGQAADGSVITTVGGGQNSYALIGVFARLNYDYKGRYLFELSGRYDGTSRFADGHRWGFFPSASLGWRISEEPFFAPARKVVDNLKLRASFGSLGNQNVGYYDYMRKISIADYKYSFNEGSSLPKKATLSAPVSGDLTWETSQQWNVGLDLAMLSNRLELTAEAYIRDTKNMLTEGMALPAVYGADSPKMNSADLRTRGYELSLSWRDQFKLAGRPFGYSIKGTLSNFDSHITKYKNNPNHLLSDYYEGMRLGDIWGYQVDGLFMSDEEAKEYTATVCDATPIVTGRLTGGFLGGDLRFADLDTPVFKVDENGNRMYDENGKPIVDHYEKDGKLSNGESTEWNPGDRKILGNSLPSLQYGFTLAFDWMGFDVSAFFQGTGNHYWYPAKMNMMFWGPYSYSYVSFIQRDFIQRCWSEDNKDAYFPRPRSYSSTGGELSKTNSYYLQNIAYLRFKNLTVGYTLPEKLTKKIGIERLRFYFTGENLAYWSPMKKNCNYVDPESAYTRDESENVAQDQMSYPWQKSFMFGIDLTF